MAEQQTRPPRFYTVPAASTAVACRDGRCGATIYFVPSTRDPKKKVPIDCNVEGGTAPTSTSDGSGVSHFITCKAANVFSQRPPARHKTKAEEATPHDPACIMCGCTETRACLIDRDTLDDAAKAEWVALYSVASAAELPVRIPCGWLQLKPTPVCNAPACRAKYAELPLRLKVAK